jgi:hypothetical protein
MAAALGTVVFALACGTAFGAVPAQPTDVTAFAADGSAGVSFTAPADAGASKITGYIVTSTPGGSTQTGMASPIVVRGLTNGTAYRFTVRATSVEGDGPESTPSNFVIPTDQSGSVLDLSNAWQVVLIVLLVAMFTALWGFFLWYDRKRRYPQHDERVRELVGRMKVDPTTDEITEVMRALRQPLRFAAGLTRTMIALGLLTLVAIALIALLVGNSDNASDLLKAVVTAVLTAFTTVLGFYFGSRTAADAAEAAKPNGGAAPAPTPTSTGGSKPGKPICVQAMLDERTVVVSFVPPANPGDPPLDSYVVKAYPHGSEYVGVSSPIRVDGLRSGEHTFKVRAKNAAGDGPESDTSAPVTL